MSFPREVTNPTSESSPQLQFLLEENSESAISGVEEGGHRELEHACPPLCSNGLLFCALTTHFREFRRFKRKTKNYLVFCRKVVLWQTALEEPHLQRRENVRGIVSRVKLIAHEMMSDEGMGRLAQIRADGTTPITHSIH